jgi:hypothetical protein
MGSFFDYLWKHHQLLNLIWGEQKGKRTQGLALGVGAVVMLLWKLFSAKSEPASSLIWRLLDIQRLKGWAYTLAASKFIKFITKQASPPPPAHCPLPAGLCGEAPGSYE